MANKKANQRRCILSLLPAAVLVGGILLYPSIMTIRYSFYSWRGFQLGEFVGLENYVAIFADRAFLNTRNLLRFPNAYPPFGALIHSLIWTVLFVPGTLVLGLTFAVQTRRLPGKTIAKLMFLLPMSVPMVVGGIIVHFMVDERAGLVNAILRTFGPAGVTQTWTNNPNTALLVLIAGSIWIFSGLTMLIYAAGLETIPDELDHAAQLDGANRWQIFSRITFPILSPSHRTAVILMVIWSFKVFDLVYAATLGGPGQSSTVLGMLLFSRTFYHYRVGEGLAIGAILTVIGVGLSMLMLMKKQPD